MTRIYVDNSATTQLSEAALDAMLPCFRESYGNPSAIYSYGQEAKKSLENARSQVARAIGALSTEIFFTSGGTESDNWALQGICEQKSSKGKHIISTEIEHNAVLKQLEKLENSGFEVTLLKPDKDGQITTDQLEAAIRKDTILVSIMMANNVVGTVLNVKALCKTAHAHNVLFHTDAVQAAGHVPISVRDLGIDLLSMSAHKFHGPKGVGALFAKISRIPPPFISGGGQERGSRSGTENVPGVVGMAVALTEITQNLNEGIPYLEGLRDKLIRETLKIPGAYLTGDPVNRLPGHASFVFDGIEHSAHLINLLNEEGICASSGSACSASSKEASHVLEALGYVDNARNSLRITFSTYNTEDEIDVINEKLPGLISTLRNRSKTSLFI